MTGQGGFDANMLTAGLIGRLGIDITEVSAERVVGTMPVEGNTQPYGLLHGGATAALAETLGSFGAMAHALPDRIAVGVDLNITHVRGATSGTVRAIATAVHLGRTVATYQIDVTDDEDRLVATARLTCVLKTRL
jgi:1,4-dihydroxy-2-naphthoyl-CoA hydrolase